MIYIVDEDIAQLRAEASELGLRGYGVTFLRNADEAFDVLVSCALLDTELVLIDVMLATHEDASRSRYSREKTDNFLKTGLLLLDDLVAQNPSTFPSKVVLFTNANNQDLLAAVNQACERYTLQLIRKRDYNTAYEFGNRIEGILQRLNGSTVQK